MFVMSLTRFTIDHPRGTNYVCASRDLRPQNSPITKLRFVILTTTGRKNLCHSLLRFFTALMLRSK